MSTELRECPFCGEERIFLNPPSLTYPKGSINCPACLACMPGEVDERELIASWNQRAAEAERDALRAALAPFAAFAEKAERFVQGRADFGGSPIMPTKQFRLADFQRAARALSGKGDGE